MWFHLVPGVGVAKLLLNVAVLLIVTHPVERVDIRELDLKSGTGGLI